MSQKNAKRKKEHVKRKKGIIDLLIDFYMVHPFATYAYSRYI